MSTDSYVLVMKYSPAKKAVEFHRFDLGKEVIPFDGPLMRYEQDAGNFVLQNHGEKFFDDIAYTFDGVDSVSINVITTKIDYEDFQQMAEYYNAHSQKCKLTPALLAELPDSNRTFDNVKEFGRSSIALLTYHADDIAAFNSSCDAVSTVAKQYAYDMMEIVSKIRQDVDALIDNRVNLCFAGVYSSGKSTMINAILGYKILPEDMGSKTARMFCISSPKDGTTPAVQFDIDGAPASIVWRDGDINVDVYPKDSEYFETLLTGLQEKVDAAKPIHEQIYCVLDYLNAAENVSSIINVEFPVPLDTQTVQFAIYDTPGSDSKNEDHKAMLMGALEDQTHSILVFLAKPDGLEATGNKILFDCLKEIEEKKGRSTIDISRSLFVINKADDPGLRGADDFKKLQTAELRQKDSGSGFPLKDKKLFFVSAKYAYLARAMKNNIADDDEHELYEMDRVRATNHRLGHYYQHNRCGVSELGTQLLLEKCKDALNAVSGNGPEELAICSGIYALEREICTYGEKYASAVRAHAIISGIDRSLVSLENTTDIATKQNEKSSDDKRSELEALERKLTEAIDASYSNMLSDKTFSDRHRHELHIDGDSIQKDVVDPIVQYVDKNVTELFLGLGEVIPRERMEKGLQSEAQSLIGNFVRRFTDRRRAVLEAERDNFLAGIRKAIQDNGNISDEAKAFILDIPPTDVNAPDVMKTVASIYKSNQKKTNSFHRVFFSIPLLPSLVFAISKTGDAVKGLFGGQTDDVTFGEFRKEFFNRMDKDKFKSELKAAIASIAGEIALACENDYRTSLDKILAAVCEQFKKKLGTYSATIRAGEEDIQAMMRLGEMLRSAANDLRRCLDELNNIIWHSEDKTI